MALLPGQITGRHLISVPERGRKRLSREEWSALEDAAGFWRLVDSGYLGCRRLPGGQYELQGHKYVGRAVVGNVDLRIEEKVRGALPALIGAATGGELRLEVEDSPAGDFDSVSRHLMRAFSEAAGRYIAQRREPRFRYREATGPSLGGTLDMAATMRLHASGRLGMFAFRRSEIVRGTPLDKLVLAAFDELDQAGDALLLDPGTLYEARWLAGALADVRDRDFVTTSRAKFIELADKIQVSSGFTREDTDLARLAAVVLLHTGFGSDSDEDLVPRAWFLDMETLFEKAVRRALGELLPATTVDRGKAYGRHMFFGGIDSSRTNPDIVVHRGGAVLAVGDVKYKALVETGQLDGKTSESKKEARADLYQVLVHAASLGSRRAFLVYPAESVFVSRHLGRSATGCQTWTAQVRPNSLVKDLGRILDEIGLGEGRLRGRGVEILAAPVNALAE